MKLFATLFLLMCSFVFGGRADDLMRRIPLEGSEAVLEIGNEGKMSKELAEILLDGSVSLSEISDELSDFDLVLSFEEGEVSLEVLASMIRRDGRVVATLTGECEGIEEKLEKVGLKALYLEEHPEGGIDLVAVKL